MAVKPYIWGQNREKDDFMLKTIQEGRRQYGDKFDSVMESRFGIKKSDYMGESYDKLVSTAQTGGKQAVDNLYNSNNSSQYRNPITNYSATPTKPRNILPGTTLGNYGDLGGASSVPKYSGKGVGVTYSQVRLSDVAKNGAGFLWNDRAREEERRKSGYLRQRNDFLANAFYNEGIDSKEGIAQYLGQFGDFANANQADKDNTVAAIWNRIGEINKANTQSFFDDKKGYDINALKNNPLDPNATNSNNLSDEDYRQFVNTTLKTNFDQFGDLNKLKETYGDEAFYKLKDFLNAAKGAYDITNPEERNRLAGDMQKMLGSFIGNQSDLSKLNLNMESGLSLFSPESQAEIKSDLEKMGQLEGMGMNAQQIADKLGWTTDKVYQLNLLKQGSQATRLGKYYNLSDTEKARLSEETDIARQRLKEDHELAMQRQDRDLQRLTETHQKNYERQKRQNEINEGNANMLAGLTGIGFSSRGIQGLQEIQTQAKEILDDMTTKYERGKIQINDIKMDLVRAYERKDADMVRQLNESLVQAKNAYISGVAQLQSKYGLVSMEGQKALAEATKGFIESAQKIYMDASTNARANLKSLIDAKTDLMNYEYKQLEFTNAKKKQVMSESMYMTPQMAMQYAQEHGFADQIDEVLNYQMQATVNTLESYAPGAGMKYQGEIQAMLNKGYTPAQTISNLMGRSDFSGFNKAGSKSYAPITIGKDTRGVYDPNTGKITYFGQGGGSATASGAYQRVDLGEQAIDTGMKNVYGSNVKLAPTVWNMLQGANQELSQKGIQLKIGDSYRSYETQKKSYESGKAGVAKPGLSFHEKGQAFDVVQDGSMYTDDVVQALLNAGFTRPVKSEPWHWSYGEGPDVFGGGTAIDNEPLSDNGIPISYEQKIYNLVPTSLKNSDTELKNLYSKAKQLYQAGMTPEDAVLTFMGFKVSEKDKPFAQMILDHARVGEVAEDFYGKVSDYINKGNKIQAIKLMENQLKAKAENKGNVRESTAISMIKMINELETKMAEGEQKFGPISGRWNKGYTKWLGGKETQAINSQIVSLYSQLRNQMNGSNVTESETKWLEPLIPDMNDKYENAKAKISVMKNKILSDINGVRQDLNLPLLDSQSLVDHKARLQLYMNGGVSYEARGIQGSGKKVNAGLSRT